MRRIALALLLPFAIAACAASGPLYVEAPLPANGDAIVYVYRMPTIASAARDAHFHIDGRHVFDLSNGGYAYIALPAGKHELMQDWSWEIAWGKAIKLPVVVKAGEVRFFRFGGDMTASGSAIATVWNLSEVAPAEARQEIAGMRLQGAVQTSDSSR
jgi:hypothetical protein